MAKDRTRCVKLVYKPNPIAERFHQDLTHQVHAITGAWGTGKSHAALWDMYLFQTRHEDADILIVRDTYSALNDSCISQFMRIFGDYGHLSGGNVPDFNWLPQLRGEHGKPITGTIKFRAAALAHEVQKFLSVEVGAAFLEESTPGITGSGILSQGLPPELFAGIFARVRQIKSERRIVLTAAPPPATEHWFHTIFYEKKPLTDLKTMLTGQGELSMSQVGVSWENILEKTTHWDFTRNDNAENLPEGYSESILPFLSTPDQVARFYYGRVPQGSYAGWPVYPSWRDAIHVNTTLHADPGPLVRGWDGGLTPACVWLQLPPSGGVRLLMELQGTDVGLEQFAPQVLALGQQQFGGVRPYLDFGDPAIDIRSANDLVQGADILRKFGIHLQHGIQDPWTRIQAVRSWLTPIGLFQANPRCKLAIAGFRGAYKRQVKNGVPGELPDKTEPESQRHSHVMNAIEYVATRLTGQARAAVQEPLSAVKIDHLGQWPGRTFSSGPRARKTHRGIR
jgi:hypothetical protein